MTSTSTLPDERNRIAVVGVLAIVIGACARPSVAPITPARSCAADTLAIARGSVRDASSSQAIARGIRYRCLVRSGGPWVIHAVEIDLAHGYVVDAEHANGALRGRERTSAMLARLAAQGDTALVAINADFFDLTTGEVRNNEVVRGRWHRAVSRTVAARDVRSQFALTVDGRPIIGRLTLNGWLVADRDSVQLAAVNATSVPPAGIVLYTPAFGEQTPRDSAASATGTTGFALLANRHGDSSEYVRGADLASGSGVPIPPHGAVVVFGDSARQARSRIAAGAVVRVRLGVDGTAIRTLVGGWPRIVTDGRSVAASADSAERTAASFSAARHPRSAVGISRDGRRLILAVVDGRRPWSVGMTLTEWADALLGLGAHQALNLDGGGSTTLIVGAGIVNVPSDAAGERAVGNALLVFRRRERR